MQVTGDFVADRDAHVHEDPAFPGISVEEFDREVTWSAPLRLADHVHQKTCTIRATVNGQVCEANGSCELIADVPVAASFAGYSEPPQTCRRIRGEQKDTSRSSATSSRRWPLRVARFIW